MLSPSSGFPPVRITLFGGLRVHLPDRTIDRFRTRKAASLFAFLACRLPERHSRAQIAATLWTECDPDAALRNLRRELNALHTQLQLPQFADAAPIYADRTTLGLEPHLVTTDLAEARRCLHQIRAQQPAEMLQRRVERLRVLTSAVFLPELDDPWALQERTRFQLMAQSALRHAALELQRLGVLEEAEILAAEANALTASPASSQEMRTATQETLLPLPFFGREEREYLENLAEEEARSGRPPANDKTRLATAAARERRAERYLLWLERISATFVEAPGAWMRAVEEERANLCRALETLQRRPDKEPAARFVLALWSFWSARELMAEACTALEALLPHRATLSPEVAWMLLRRRGDVENKRGDFAAARRYYTLALEMAQEHDLREAAQETLLLLTHIVYMEGRYAEASSYIERVYAYPRLNSDIASDAYRLRGQIALAQGELPKAYALILNWKECCEGAVSELDCCETWNALGVLETLRGDFRAAHGYLQRCLTFRETHGIAVSGTLTRRDLGGLALAQGDAEQAIALYQRCLAELPEPTNPETCMDLRARLAYARLLQGEGEGADAAAGELRTCLDFWRERGHPRWRALTQRQRALAEFYAGRLPEAERAIEESVAYYQEAGDQLGETLSRTLFGRIRAYQGDLAGAETILLPALQRLYAWEARPSWTLALDALAECAAFAEEWECASRLLGNADMQYRTMGGCRPPIEARRRDYLTQRLQERLGSEGYWQAHEGGQWQSAPEAIAEILSGAS